MLRFPGGDSHDPIACTYCPEMCRFSCPTAVASGNDAVTPCNKMSLLHLEKRWPGKAAQGGELWPLYDCTGCGRCTEFCKYGMPVQEKLFAARAEFGWSKAREVAAALTDAEDPVGDLAEELGDEASASRRLAAWGTREVSEPRQAHFARGRGVKVELAIERALGAELTDAQVRRLWGKRWLVLESVWLSRMMGCSEQMLAWVERARGAGVELVLPFHHGGDCIDTGGEGAYPRLFAEQARTMAVDVWERDRGRADAVLCVSTRQATHLRASLGAGVEVVALVELLKGSWT